MHFYSPELAEAMQQERLLDIARILMAKGAEPPRELSTRPVAIPQRRFLPTLGSAILRDRLPPPA